MNGELTAERSECASARELASAEIDGELTTEASALRDHVGRCEGCRLARGRLQWVVGLVHAVRGALVLVGLLVVGGRAPWPRIHPPRTRRSTRARPLPTHP